MEMIRNRSITGLYKKIAIPTVFHGTELWNKITKKDLNTIQPFQHFIAKHIQNFNRRTRSDIYETIFHLLRLPTLVDKRNFIFFYRNYSTLILIYLQDKYFHTVSPKPSKTRVWFYT